MLKKLRNTALLLIILLQGCVVYTLKQVDKNPIELEEDKQFLKISVLENNLKQAGIELNNSPSFKESREKFKEKFHYDYISYKKTLEDRDNIIYKYSIFTTYNKEINDEESIQTISTCADILEPIASDSKTVLEKKFLFNFSVPMQIMGNLGNRYNNSNIVNKTFFTFVDVLHFAVLPIQSLFSPLDLNGYSRCITKEQNSIL